MPKPIFPTITEQVAAHLREELLRGRWTSEMPGRHEVAAELGVSPQTVQFALALLEKDGVLVSQGPGRPRRIELPTGAGAGLPSLRVAILVGEPADRQRNYMVEIKHELDEAGHSPFFTPWFMPELGVNVPSIAADCSAPRRMPGSCSPVPALLEWFVEHEMPAFALFGRRRGLPIAGVGPDKPPALSRSDPPADRTRPPTHRLSDPAGAAPAEAGGERATLPRRTGRPRA